MNHLTKNLTNEANANETGKNKQLEEIIQELKATFKAFTQKNDQRIESIKQEKTKLTDDVEKINEKLNQLDDYKKAIEKDIKTLNRSLIVNPNATDDHNEFELAHREAFYNFAKTGNTAALDELQAKGFKTKADSVNVSAGDEGGYLVPKTLSRQILQIERENTIMEQICNVQNIAGSDYAEVVVTGGISSGWVGEKDARPNTDAPEFQEIKPDIHEIYANVPITRTALDESFLNLETYLSNEIGLQFAESADDAFITGTGAPNKKPLGLLKYPVAATEDKVRPYGTLQTIETATKALVNTDDLISLPYHLKPAYRTSTTNVGWLINRLSLITLRTAKDKQGQYYWSPALQAGQPATFLGYPIYESDYMPKIAASATPIAFGNFSRAITIYNRFAVRILRDPYTRKPFINFYATRRTGLKVRDTHAIKFLSVKA